jgi:hypothetical protein
MRDSNGAAMSRMAEGNLQTIVRTWLASMQVDSALKQHATKMEHVKAKRRREAGV